MADDADNPSRPKSEDSVLGPNPYEKEDPRHAQWLHFRSLDAEGDARSNAAWLGRAARSPEQFPRWRIEIEVMLERFDRGAALQLEAFVTDDETLEGYVHCLRKEAQWMHRKFLDESSPTPSSRQAEANEELRMRLAQHVESWKAEALRHVRESLVVESHGKATTAATVPTTTLVALPGPDKVGGPKLAAFLETEMEKRDHMTPTTLHSLTGLDRKTIKKMLAGERVREVRVRKLAQGLKVPLAEIPSD